MEVVPSPEPPFLLLDDQHALPRQHEEPLLRVLRVVERARIALPQNADVDADVSERRFTRLERVERSASFGADCEGLLEVVHEPPL